MGKVGCVVPSSGKIVTDRGEPSGADCDGLWVGRARWSRGERALGLKRLRGFCDVHCPTGNRKHPSGNKKTSGEQKTFIPGRKSPQGTKTPFREQKIRSPIDPLEIRPGFPGGVALGGCLQTPIKVRFFFFSAVSVRLDFGMIKGCFENYRVVVWGQESFFWEG